MASGEGGNGGGQMTARAFERLLYTDCRAGTGRGAGGGFQIQAQSSGVDAAQARMAVGCLLYEVQNSWIVQHRPVSDFPPGFAHASAAGYGTSQSRYLGQEATGGRQGNHLADCILTRNPDLYGATRPAQLWRSDLWRSEPWASTNCPEFDGVLSIGPLTVDAIASWLRESPAREPILGRLLTVLEDPAGRRVVIVATDPDEAVWWIAAATLLLPMRVALGISFKVFCADPLRAEQRIAAVPRELNPQIAPGQAESSFILDAGNCVSDDADVSDRAQILVAQLTHADDPYDVVDAVELAESLDPGDRPADADATITAWALTLPTSPLVDPAALLRWLSQANPLALQEHGRAVAARILEARPAVDALRLIDAAASHGQIDVDRVALRGQLFSAELADARDGVAPPPQQLSNVGLDFETYRDADSELTSAILLGSDSQIDVLLRLAHRHGITPEPAPLAGRLQNFAAQWVAGEFAVPDPGSWAFHEEILDFAYDELRARLTQYGAADVLGILRRLHPHFAHRPADAADPLDAYRRVAEVAALPARRRAPALRAILQHVIRLSVPANDIAGMQHAMVQWGVINPAEAFEFLVCLPEPIDVDPDIARIASDELLRRAGQPDRQVLDLLAILDRRGLVPKGSPLAALRASDQDVQIFIHATRNDRILSDNEYAQSSLRHLSRADPVVFRARLRSIVTACLECPRPDLGSALLRDIPSQRKAVLLLWTAELAGPNSVSAAVWGFNCIQDPALPSRAQIQIADTLRNFGTRLRPADRDKWHLDVGKRLPPEEAHAWAAVSGRERPKSRHGWLFRAKGG